MSEDARLDLRHGTQRMFLHVLVNTVLVHSDEHRRQLDRFR